MLAVVSPGNGSPPGSEWTTDCRANAEPFGAKTSGPETRERGIEDSLAAVQSEYSYIRCTDDNTG